MADTTQMTGGNEPGEVFPLNEADAQDLQGLDDPAAGAAAGESDEHDPGETGESGEEDGAGYEEIEVGGQKYAVPRELKDAFLRQDDYTRKTQEVAAQRKSVEARAAELQAAAETQARDSEASVAIVMIDQQLPEIDRKLDEYSRVDWSKFREDNFVDYQTHWNYYQQLQFGRSQLLEKKRELAGQIEKNAAERGRRASEDIARRIDETQRVVSRDIEGWGPELATKLTQFGAGLGFTQEEMFSLNTDPRQIKALHLAWLGHQLVARHSKNPAGKRLAPAFPGTKVVKPLSTVAQTRSRPASSADPSDHDTDEEWLRKRNAQLRKKPAKAR